MLGHANLQEDCCCCCIVKSVFHSIFPNLVKVFTDFSDKSVSDSCYT